jgi:glutathione synthase/RimK-type ligase-like ATP-grasp enzyme
MISMVKKVVFSVVQNHEVIVDLIDKLKKSKEFELITHDPTKKYFRLSNMPKQLKEADLIIVKVRNECSIDLLHFAKLNNIPTLHDVDTVLLCKNKIALDYALRKAFKNNPQIRKKFSLPDSWNNSVRNVKNFKKWALNKLPIVIKSHYQHDKYNRFNFLVKNIGEVDIFLEKYRQFTFYDVYIQKFIECDGLERKIYVIGDKVFGIERENPIYIFIREKPDIIKVNKIQRKEYEISDEIIQLAHILSKELKLKIFGFDLVKSLNKDRFYLIDLNDFPGFRGIPNIQMELKHYLESYILAL